ncbi:octapeptide-repeat protein T2-like isoform X1 [Dermacentor silvarum]|uniref:octapeptide-repeat protein T2-like isoform X1 n=2 Tax=Dermacentor silvarum TaxID=543639 RepID=UPI00210134C4|nr:octapeptide-repeat protein T2-like isoform X1 [Dermacentor silvarum]
MEAVASASAEGTSAGITGAYTWTVARGRPRNTEAQNAEAKARHAEATRRKRRENAELRARDVEAKRQRRAMDPELRAREAEARRRRREDPEKRAREIEAKRQRRQDPEYRAREAEAKRQRRQRDRELRTRVAALMRQQREHWDFRVRETESRRQQCQEVPELRAMEAETKQLGRQADAEQRAQERLCQHAVTEARNTQRTYMKTKMTSTIRERNPRPGCHSKYVGEGEPLPQQAHRSCQTEHHITLVWCARPNVSTCSAGVQVGPWEQEC